jgi:hypothetical protein
VNQTTPYIPRPTVLWRSFRLWAWAAFAFLALSAVPDIVVQYWFNQSLGFQSLFKTNFGTQAALFTLYGAALAMAVYLPIRQHARTATLRSAGLHVGLWVGIIGGWYLAGEYQQFLLAFYGVPFDRVDPVFGNDIGLYVYRLPAWRVVLTAIEAAALAGMTACLVARADELTHDHRRPKDGWDARRALGAFAVPSFNVLACTLGTAWALGVYLSPFDLLLKENDASGVRTGAGYVDVVGAFSTLNSIYLLFIVTVGLTVVGVGLLSRLHLNYLASLPDPIDPGTMPQQAQSPNLSLRGPLLFGAGLVALQFCFYVTVLLRNYVFVQPNEPSIQEEYIGRHIDATLDAYGLSNVETHEWVPPSSTVPVKNLLASQTVQNAPVVAPWTSYLEEPPDVQHLERIAVSDSKMVFGPVLQTFQQHQQLRPYYDFLSVDGVRYSVEGQKRMFASAVRELPSLALVGQKEWLKYWGSSALLFTHGMGLVMSPVNEVDELGNAIYASQEVPPRVESPALEHEPRVYFGEGAKDEYVLTNTRYLKEFDYATEQSREEFTFPSDLTDGIHLNSLFKRLIFAAYTKDVTAFLFSRYIDPKETRVHIRRTPIARIQSLAPFLFLDTNSYAFVADKRVLWMVNGLTTSDQYPYAFPEVLGDKSDERAVEFFPERVINYAEDSVKVTVDAYSGDVRFYKMSDDPIVNTWARVYPDLFEPAAAMPKQVEEQLTYPLQWLHIQFDDIYKRYHQREPFEFYNLEDIWDDADDTLGSIGRGLSGFGTGDQMTFSYEGYDALLDPQDLPEGVDIGEPGELQFAKLMPFTPESGRNLRSLIIALQDPGSYGRLISLQIPQGMFVPGPEQIDAYIDNDRPVHQQVTMWIRHASEVIRGRTLLLPVRGDLIYVETIWVNSLQNDLPQLKLVAVRYRDQITSGATLQAAILKRESTGTVESIPRDPMVRLAKRENRQRDGDSGSGDQQTDGKETADAQVDAVALQYVQPQQAGQGAHRQEARP